MICPECRGKGTAIYFCEIARDENNVVVKKHEDVCHTCHGSGRKPQTNADRIRSLSDEELAEYLVSYNGHSDRYEAEAGCFYELEDAVEAELGWLRQPVKDGEEE